MGATGRGKGLGWYKGMHCFVMVWHPSRESSVLCFVKLLTGLIDVNRSATRGTLCGAGRTGGVCLAFARMLWKYLAEGSVFGGSEVWDKNVLNPLVLNSRC